MKPSSSETAFQARTPTILTTQRKQQASSPVRRKPTTGYSGPGPLSQGQNIRSILGSAPAMVQKQGAQPMVYPKGCTLTRAEVTPSRKWNYPWNVGVSYTLNTTGKSYYKFYLVKQKECAKTGKPSGYLLGGANLGGIVTGSDEFPATTQAVNNYPYAMMVNESKTAERSCKKWTK